MSNYNYVWLFISDLCFWQQGPPAFLLKFYILLSQAVFHQSCFISAATALGSVPRLDLCHVKRKGKMLSEMESIFFKTANLNQ